MALPLNESTLLRHRDRLDVPRYDRDALAPAVLHLSVGAFHRSHQAVYFDSLARLGHREWGLGGVGLHRPEMREALGAQDGLYTVVSRGAEGSSARVIGVITRYLFAPVHTDALFEAIADPRLRLITLTITGPAYKVTAGGGFDADDPEISADLADPRRPLSALGFLVEGLARRRDVWGRGLTILSCDNLPANGALARAGVVGLARLRDPGLADWIEEHVAFPSSMVDRITPQTSIADRDAIAEEFGVADRWPVVTEPFSQWIVEDDFVGARPPLEEVGVQFVDDVEPYSLMKTRLLNATHAALGFAGMLGGHRRIDEAMGDAALAAFAEQLMAEAAPLLPPVPGVDLGAYRRTLLERFANPHIGDRLERLCRNGTAKLASHVVPSIVAARASGRPHDALTYAVAAWAHHLRGIDDDGAMFTVDDPRADRLGERPLHDVLADERVLGPLARDHAFAAEVEALAAGIERSGMRAALAATLA